jgi:hypothetical protein
MNPHSVYFKKTPEKAQKSGPQEQFFMLSMHPVNSLHFGTDFAGHSKLKPQKPVKKQKLWIDST